MEKRTQKNQIEGHIQIQPVSLLSSAHSSPDVFLFVLFFPRLLFSLSTSLLKRIAHTQTSRHNTAQHLIKWPQSPLPPLPLPLRVQPRISISLGHRARSGKGCAHKHPWCSRGTLRSARERTGSFLECNGQLCAKRERERKRKKKTERGREAEKTLRRWGKVEQKKT